MTAASGATSVAAGIGAGTSVTTSWFFWNQGARRRGRAAGRGDRGRVRR